MSVDDGWWAGAHHLPSPNCNERPDGVDIDVLVIHNISLPPGEYGGRLVQDFFLNQLDCSRHPFFSSIANLQVSAHFLIERDGRVTQFVPLHKRAWHAGVSNFRGRKNCNDFSIGIELEGDDETPYTDAQYRQLVELTGVIMNTYPHISVDHIVGHCDIAPGRKTDPGPAFNWPKYIHSLP